MRPTGGNGRGMVHTWYQMHGGLGCLASSKSFGGDMVLPGTKCAIEVPADLSHHLVSRWYQMPAVNVNLVPQEALECSSPQISGQ